MTEKHEGMMTPESKQWETVQKLAEVAGVTIEEGEDIEIVLDRVMDKINEMREASRGDSTPDFHFGSEAA